MIDTHIIDGVALTKFLYWIKVLNKKNYRSLRTEQIRKIQKKNKKYLFPSFDTIAGSGRNGAIIHYKANKKDTKRINKKIYFYVTQVVNISMVLQM